MGVITKQERQFAELKRFVFNCIKDPSLISLWPIDLKRLFCYKINGDICISTERVRENAAHHGVSFFNELARVMIHGVLHLCGYKDAKQNEKTIMRNKENDYLSQLFSE